MEGLSIEVLERIVRKLDHISMCGLASMSVHMRRAVHSYCSSHLRYLANQDSTTEASLEASGWEAGNDHDIWECYCIYLAVGPWYWWSKGRKKEVIVDPDYTRPFTAACTVVNNKLFTSLDSLDSRHSNTSVIVRTRDMLPQLKEAMKLPKYSNKTDPPSFSNFENTLLVKFIKRLVNYEFKKYYAIMVYNSQTLNKICDIDVMGTITDSSLKRHLEIPDIKMCKNKIAIHLNFGKSKATQNVTRIWTVDTKSPKKESIFLVKTVTHSFKGLLEDEGQLLAMNSRFLVKIGQEDLYVFGASKNMMHFESQLNENVNETIPINDNESYNNLKILTVWHASIIPGLGSILCLGLVRSHYHGLEIPNPRPEFHNHYSVQLFDLSTKEVVTEKQLSNSVNRLFDNHHNNPKNMHIMCKISWWSDHLAVFVRDSKVSASVYSWSPGQTEILELRIKLPLGGLDWRIKYFHMDYQGIVIAKANSDKTAFQCYKYDIEKEKAKNMPSKDKKGMV